MCEAPVTAPFVRKGKKNMNADMAEQLIQLRVPSKSQMMLVIRLTTSGVMARAGLTMDAMEDLKMAIEEACNCMIQHAQCDMLELTFAIEGDAVRITVEGIGEGPTPFIGENDEVEVIECILRSMVDEVEIHGGVQTPCRIMMKKLLPA